ncbi:MAG: glycosyltransferase family 4 protein, partial [Desulfobacteraceae bacterium]
MKLAFCLFKYFPFGGLQKDFMNIVNECLARGYEVHAYVITWEGEIPEGLRVTRVPVSGLSNHKRYASFARRTIEHVKEEGYDAVVGFNKIPGLDVYFAADMSFAAKMKDRNFLYRLTDRYRTCMRLERSVFDKDLNTQILLLTEKEKSFYMKYYGTSPDRFHLIPPGISKACLPPEEPCKVRAEKRLELGIHPEAYVLLMVCTNFKIKGVARAIRALSALPSAIRSGSLLIVAGMDNPAPYRKLAAGHNVAENVRFLGARRDIPELLTASDLLLHPASIENTGTVLVEAIVAELPVLTTETCGYSFHVTRSGSGVVAPGWQPCATTATGLPRCTVFLPSHAAPATPEEPPERFRS